MYFEECNLKTLSDFYFLEALFRGTVPGMARFAGTVLVGMEFATSANFLCAKGKVLNGEQTSSTRPLVLWLEMGPSLRPVSKPMNWATQNSTSSALEIHTTRTTNTKSMNSSRENVRPIHLVRRKYYININFSDRGSRWYPKTTIGLCTAEATGNFEAGGAAVHS